MSDSITTSLAAVFRVVGEPLTLERFPIPAAAGSEALVRIRCATICGSDLHSYFGRRHSPIPSVLGHEMVGEIAGLGPAGARLSRCAAGAWRSRHVVNGVELRGVLLLPSQAAAEVRAFRTWNRPALVRRLPVARKREAFAHH